MFLNSQQLSLSKIKSKNEDGEPMYQNHNIQFYSREKCFREDHIVQIVERVVSCFEKHYGNLYSNLKETSISIPSDDDDRIIFYVCHILNYVWPNVNR